MLCSLNTKVATIHRRTAPVHRPPEAASRSTYAWIHSPNVFRAPVLWVVAGTCISPPSSLEIPQDSCDDKVLCWPDRMTLTHNSYLSQGTASSCGRRESPKRTSHIATRQASHRTMKCFERLSREKVPRDRTVLRVGTFCFVWSLSKLASI